MQATGRLSFTLRLPAGRLHGRLGSRFPLSAALVGGMQATGHLSFTFMLWAGRLHGHLCFCHRHDASSLGFLEKSLPPADPPVSS